MQQQLRKRIERKHHHHSKILEQISRRKVQGSHFRRVSLQATQTKKANTINTVQKHWFWV
jgi:hypothetical protein